MTGECETELFDKTTSIKKRDCCKKEILQQSRYSISPKVPLHGNHTNRSVTLLKQQTIDQALIAVEFG